MTDGVKSVLEAYELLQDSEREEVLAELIRRAAHSDHQGPSDEELVEAADRVFLEYDRSESED